MNRKFLRFGCALLCYILLSTAVFAELAPVFKITTTLPGSQPDTPPTNVFMLASDVEEGSGAKDKNREFILLDTKNSKTQETEFFILAKNFYGKQVFDTTDKEQYHNLFNPNDPCNIAYFLNNEFLVSGGKELTPSSKSKLPDQVIEHIIMDHEWVTEPANDLTCGNNPNGERYPTEEYKFQAGVVLLSQTEYTEYITKFGCKDGISSSESWAWILRSTTSNDKYSNLYVRFEDGQHGMTTTEGVSASNLIRPAFYLDRSFFTTQKVDLSSLGSNVRAMLNEEYSRDELKAIYSEEELDIIFSQLPPTAADVRIEGDACVGEMLTGEFDYEDPAGQEESGSLYRWMYCKTPDGVYSDIPGATERTYVVEPAYVNQYIRFVVQPGNGELLGVESKSDPTNKIDAKPIANNVKILGTVSEGMELIGSYEYACLSGYTEASDLFYRGDQYIMFNHSYNLEQANRFSRYAWYQGDSPTGPFEPISGAEEKSFTPGADQVGKYLKFTVIPYARGYTVNTGREGEAYSCVTEAPVTAADDAAKLSTVISSEEFTIDTKNETLSNVPPFTTVQQLLQGVALPHPGAKGEIVAARSKTGSDAFVPNTVVGSGYVEGDTTYYRATSATGGLSKNYKIELAGTNLMNPDLDAVEEGTVWYDKEGNIEQTPTGMTFLTFEGAKATVKKAAGSGYSMESDGTAALSMGKTFSGNNVAGRKLVLSFSLRPEQMQRFAVNMKINGANGSVAVSEATVNGADNSIIFQQDGTICVGNREVGSYKAGETYRLALVQSKLSPESGSITLDFYLNGTKVLDGYSIILKENFAPTHFSEVAFSQQGAGQAAASVFDVLFYGANGYDVFNGETTIVSEVLKINPYDETAGTPSIENYSGKAGDLKKMIQRPIYSQLTLTEADGAPVTDTQALSEGMRLTVTSADGTNEMTYVLKNDSGITWDPGEVRFYRADGTSEIKTMAETDDTLIVRRAVSAKVEEEPFELVMFAALYRRNGQELTLVDVSHTTGIFTVQEPEKTLEIAMDLSEYETKEELEVRVFLFNNIEALQPMALPALLK